jgi:hypothetical protein
MRIVVLKTEEKMMRTMSPLWLVLGCLVSPVLAAQECQRLDYLELKEMPTQELANAACRNIVNMFDWETHRVLGPDGVAPEASRQIQKCADEQTRVMRLLNARKGAEAAKNKTNCLSPAWKKRY